MDGRGDGERPGLPGGGVYEWYTRGVRLLESGNPAAAAQLLEHAAAAEPASRSVQEALGRAQFDSKRYLEAAESFRRVVDENPSEHYAQFGRGLALVRAGEVNAAVEHLALAAAMRPDIDHYTAALRGARAVLEARR